MLIISFFTSNDVYLDFISAVNVDTYRNSSHKVYIIKNQHFTMIPKKPEDTEEYVYETVLYGGGKVEYIKYPRKEAEEKWRKSFDETYQKNKWLFDELAKV